jgi:hypothetical protein
MFSSIFSSFVVAIGKYIPSPYSQKQKLSGYILFRVSKIDFVYAQYISFPEGI